MDILWLANEVVKEPDEHAQSTVEMVFNLLKRYGTLNGVLHHFVRNGIQLPNRIRQVPAKGDLEWVIPNRVTFSNILPKSVYAGAHVYGRRPLLDPKKKKPGRPSTGKTVFVFMARRGSRLHTAFIAPRPRNEKFRYPM